MLHCNIVAGGQVCIFDNLCCLIHFLRAKQKERLNHQNCAVGKCAAKVKRSVEFSSWFIEIPWQWWCKTGSFTENFKFSLCVSSLLVILNSPPSLTLLFHQDHQQHKPEKSYHQPSCDVFTWRNLSSCSISHNFYSETFSFFLSLNKSPDIQAQVGTVDFDETLPGFAGWGGAISCFNRRREREQSCCHVVYTCAAESGAVQR